MTVAPIVQIRKKSDRYFANSGNLRELYNLKHLSMGMTDDFEVAIEEGSTMIRIGQSHVWGKTSKERRTAMKIAFIGGGNMAEAILSAILTKGLVKGRGDHRQRRDGKQTRFSKTKI